MAKRKQRKQQRQTANPASEANEEGHSDEALEWSSIPGKRIHADIADGVALADAHSAKNIAHDSNDSDDSSTDQFNIQKWNSEHYDREDDEWDEKADNDLFNPDPHDRTNKFDPGNKFDGANDAGVFLSLEVIPGDAYKVQKTGDETSGFVTKVVFADRSDMSTQDLPNESSCKGDGLKKPKAKKKELKKKDEKAANVNSACQSDNKSEEKNVEEKGLSRRERLKLKRKTYKEQAKERKRLKREQSDKSSSSQEAKGELRAPLPTSASASSVDIDNEEAHQQGITNLQTTWSITAPGVSLHTTLCTGLHSLNYAHPTPIQSATLPAAILGRRDIVGAAPTGSGKTLSYGLPILQSLLEIMEPASAENIAADEGGKTNERMPLQALILTPTRELAIQVTSELQKVCCKSIKIGTIVGGFAEVKQRRTLEKMRPPILVATPGRLWELMSSKEYSHLNDLSQLRFLVIDEADRMIKQGNFPQLQQIFDVINEANPPPEDPADLEDESSDDDDDDDRLKGLTGVRGEAKLVMLDDSILDAIERERNSGGKSAGTEIPMPMEMDDDEFEEQQQQLLRGESDSESESEEEVASVHRQTFVYSATLTLPPSMHDLIKKGISKRKPSKKKKNRHPTTVNGAIAEILEVAGARGETKIVNLSNMIPEGKKKAKQQDAAKKGNAKKVADESATFATRLPAGLTLGEIRCAQRHKDSHLYAYLVTTRQGSSGPCLVFCNSIAAVRRVGETLKTLGLPVKMLHAQMPQKSRMGALESLRTSNSRSIVVASDVAARGLDITSVTTVVHYDVARVVDTFIHRAGRTARGVGEKAVGTSISLVAPAEEREHQKICEAVQGKESKSLEQVNIDGRLLNEARERVALATKIVSCDDVESQVIRKNKWLQDTAKEAGLEVDEDMMEGGLLDGDKRDRQRFLEAKRAKVELRQLLAKPMRKQHFGKFLSGAGLRESIKSEGEVQPFVVKESLSRGKHNRKKAKRNRK